MFNGILNIFKVNKNINNDKEINSKHLNFEDFKESIIYSLNSKNNSLGINENTTLLSGFFDFPIEKTLGYFKNSYVHTIPAICLIGEDTGRLYFFALKAILPDIEKSKNDYKNKGLEGDLK